MPKLEVTLIVDKVTKGAVRYREQELGSGPVFPVLYIRNEALLALGSRPDTIKVTVEVA